MKTTGPDKATVALVVARDGGCCVVCGAYVVGERGRDWSLHHRKPRGMGGTRNPDANSPINLLTVCGNGTSGCHGRIERQRPWALYCGLLLSQYADPGVTPVLIDQESRWRYVTSDGRYVEELTREMVDSRRQVWAQDDPPDSS